MNHEQTISHIRTELAAGLTITLTEYLAESMKANAEEYPGTEPTDAEAFWGFLDDLNRLLGIDISAIDRDALYDRVVAQISETQKYWLADDKQATLGPWPASTANEEIWAELRDQGHDGTGSIETGAFTE